MSVPSLSGIGATGWLTERRLAQGILGSVRCRERDGGLARRCLDRRHHVALVHAVLMRDRCRHQGQREQREESEEPADHAIIMLERRWQDH